MCCCEGSSKCCPSHKHMSRVSSPRTEALIGVQILIAAKTAPSV